MKRITGDYLRFAPGTGSGRAYLPRPLPPEPALAIDADLQARIDETHLLLGRLDSISDLLPATRLFLWMYVRKEAVLSSQIEGTQSSLSDLLLFEAEEMPGVPLDDVQEVSNYVAALDHGLRRLREGLPLGNRLLREIHGVLLTRGRGSTQSPGRFRRSQNWIGGRSPDEAVFVPPPADRVAECMAGLERFLHDDPVRTQTLQKAALAHVQFETIHPFLDGNGRLGRLLITLIFCREKILREPLLYLSLYFKSRRQEYYERLQRVRTDGAWEEWFRFFVDGVRETADSAIQTGRSLAALFEEDRRRLQGLGRGAGSALRIQEALCRQPILSIAKAREMTGLSVPTVTSVMRTLEGEKVGIVRELTGRRRNRLFVYQRYFEILNEGTQPL